MAAFTVGMIIGVILAVLAGGAVSALSDRQPSDKVDTALVKAVNERNKLRLALDDADDKLRKIDKEFLAKCTEVNRLEKRVAELEAMNNNYRREHDRLLLENARLREVDYEGD